MDALIRPLHAGEADAFAALVRHAFAGLVVNPPASALALSGDVVRAHFASGGGGFTTEPAQAGLLWIERDRGLYVSRMAVHPDQRRHGLASRLLGAADAEARRRGLPRMWLSTRLAFESNRRLFAANGFVEVTRHAHSGFSEPTFVDMAKFVG